MVSMLWSSNVFFVLRPAGATTVLQINAPRLWGQDCGGLQLSSHPLQECLTHYPAYWINHTPYTWRLMLLGWSYLQPFGQSPIQETNQASGPPLISRVFISLALASGGLIDVYQPALLRDPYSICQFPQCKYNFLLASFKQHMWCLCAEQGIDANTGFHEVVLS